MMRKSPHFLWLIFFTLPTYAQEEDHVDPGIATITSELCVSLDADNPIQEFYSIGFSHLDFESAKIASDRFGFISNNLLTYSVDYEAETAELHVHLDRTPEPKDIVWWNEYLSSLCGLYHEE
jgi:hypothetical protein